MKEHKIYIVQRRDGLVKVGTTINVDQRLATLSKSHGSLNVVRIINGDRKREMQLHRTFRDHHQYGEWFSASVLPLVAEMPEGDQVPSSQSTQKASWDAAERKCAEFAHRALRDMVALRRARHSLTRDEALAEISSDYELPHAFLQHIFKGRALTISAHGYQALNAAVLAEMEAMQLKLSNVLAEHGLAQPKPEEGSE